MKNTNTKLVIFGAIALIIVMVFPISSFTVAAQQSSNWQEVEKVFGRKGTVQDDVFKVTFPRSDLEVKVGKVSVDPGLALTSWIAFKPVGNQTVIMGDIVLLENEIGPVMSKLAINGIGVTGLHNHILGESPKVMYMHFSGQGDPVKLAETMKSALSITGTPIASSAQSQSATTQIDWSKVESILGKAGKHKENLLQISVPRTETITENGMDIPPSMGVATAINLQMIGDKAATAGDFVLLGSEVNPVVKALTEHDIAVTAIHNHMLSESPRLFFLHFWAVDNPEKLARGLRAALDKTNSMKKK